MRKRSRDSLPETRAPVLTAPILAGIHELNRDYVDLLIADQEGRRLAAQLPPSVIAGLAALPAAARNALAASPFTLYSPGLESQDFWRISAVSSAAAPFEMHYRLREALSPECCFNVSALFFAWHVARSQRMAAKVFYALPDVAIDGLACMQLWELQRIGADSPGLLKPRWPANSCFWPDLVRFAAAGDTMRLHTTQLHGAQLIAAELRSNTASRSALRSVPRSLRVGDGRGI